MPPPATRPGERPARRLARQGQSLAERSACARLGATEVRSLAFAALILACLPAEAEPYGPPYALRDRDARPVPSFGGASQHYAAARRGRGHAASVPLQPGFFYGAGGVGGQAAYAQTYVFYGIPYARPRGFVGARPVSQVQVRVDGQ